MIKNFIASKFYVVKYRIKSTHKKAIKSIKQKLQEFLFFFYSFFYQYN